MDELIQALAHAIRNPLTGISINVQYLQMVYGQTSAQREIYADVMEAVARLDQMIREFVEFTGTLPLRPEPVDLNVLLSRALVQHDALLQSRRLKVSSHLDPAVPEIEADLNHFSRALAGLIEHCAWGAEEGEALSVSSRVTPETVMLEISRSGLPLSSQRRDTLFDPIAALKGPESGFGMAFVQKILTAHGCRLEINNNSGEPIRYSVVVREA
jgi:nitrogen fixation/metabolism regulation signal transduction histidine kinase